MKYLILCDMDGTILNNNNNLDELTVNTVKELSKNHVFCLLTSDNFQNTLPHYSKLNLNTFIACKNGGLIFNPHTSERITYTLSKEQILEIFNDLKPILSSCFYTRESNAYVYKFNDRFKYIMPIPEDFIVHSGDFNKLNLAKSTNLYIIIEPMHVDKLLKYFKDKNIRTSCLGSDRNRAIFVVSNPKVSKREALLFLKDYYKCSKIIGFGDTDNDVNFLKNCDIPFLMKNSSIKNFEFNITEFSNNEDGVAKELIKIFNLQ